MTDSLLNWLPHLGRGLAWILAAYVGIFSLYAALNLVGSLLRRQAPKQANTHASFVVLIPAHNEELGIASTVRQILQTDYPLERISILVVADNCTDRTAECASQAGAHVLTRSDLTNRGKGQALGWALSTHQEIFRQADLIAFIDADMDVHRDFFTAMSGTFDDTSIVVAQGRDIVGNPSRGVLSAIGFASFCYVNHVRPEGRCFWGGTADLKGTGMVFRSSFLLPRGWNAHSIAEDAQMSKDLMLEGIRVEFVSDAIVTSDIPQTLRQVSIQQSRWDGGKHRVIASVLPRTFAAFLRRPSALLADGLLDMLIPPLSVVVLLNVMGLALAWWAEPVAVPVFFVSLASFTLAVLAGLVKNKAPAGVYWRLAAAPMFVVWKLVLLLRIAIRPAETSWNRTPRS